MDRLFTFLTFRLNTKRAMERLNARTSNFFPRAIGKTASAARLRPASRFMRETAKRIVFGERYTTAASFGRSCRYEHDAISTRRASSSRLQQARKRIPVSRGYPLRIFHEPPIQIVRANRIRVDIACVHSQASDA